MHSPVLPELIFFNGFNGFNLSFLGYLKNDKETLEFVADDIPYPFIKLENYLIKTEKRQQNVSVCSK